MAQIFTQEAGPGYNFRYENLFIMLNKLACYFLWFAIILVSIMMVYYGIMFLMSWGSPQGMQNARKALTWGIVGGLVIFGVFVIILSFASLIGVEYDVNKLISACSTIAP